MDGPVPDTQMLVEKIVKLQRSCARRQVGFQPNLMDIE